MTALKQAIQTADLPALVASLYPDSGAKPSSTHHRARAVWRGGDGTSVSFWRGRDGWMLTDFARGEHYNAYTFLTECAQLSPREATALLLQQSTTAPAPARARVKQVTPDKKAKQDLEHWHKLSKTGSSAYLTRKRVAGVSCEALRFGRGRIGVLMSVIKDGRLEPVSVQWVFDDGAKLFAKGGTTSGALALIGANKLQDLHGRVYVCEGYATGATLHLATGCPVVVAFSAHNITNVVAGVRRYVDNDLELVIAADNDQYHRADVGNPGLEQAHSAALTYRARVVAPSFADTTTKPTDFNDLHVLQELPAVADQLEPRLPSALLAFANDRRKRDKRLKHATHGRYLPVIDQLPRGVTVIRSPQGTGKTHALASLIADYEAKNMRVLYVSHRVSLTRDAARRLDLYNYDDLDGRDIRAVGSLACCVNSLHRLRDDTGNLTPFDVVIIDESEQLTNALRGAHITRKQDSLAALEFFLRRADRLVCLDADAGAFTTRLLQRYRPSERVNWINHHYDIGNGRELRVYDSKGDVYRQLEQLEQPVMVVTNSRRESERVAAFLESRGKVGRLINGDTSASEQDFLADIDASCYGLDFLVCSPSVSTGVSLESGHFKHVVGFFGASIGTPEDAMQAIWRVRTPATYDLWIDPRVSKQHIDLEARYGALSEHERELIGRELPLHSNAAYEDLKRLAESVEQQKQATYRVNFLRLAVLQGFDVELVEASDDDTSALIKEARELADTRYVESVLSDARYVDTRANISEFYALAEDDDLKRFIELDDRGRYRKRVQRLELALGGDELLERRVNELLEHVEMKADMPALASEREFNRKLLRAVRFNEASTTLATGASEQRHLPRYSVDSLETFRAWIEDNRQWLAGLIALPTKEQLEQNILRYVGSWLKRLGLKQTRTGNTHDRTYSLELASLQVLCEVIKRRSEKNTLSCESTDSEKSVLNDPGGGGRWLQRLESAVTRGVFDHIPNLDTLKAYLEQARGGCKASLEALRAYCEHEAVKTAL